MERPIRILVQYNDLWILLKDTATGFYRLPYCTYQAPVSPKDSIINLLYKDIGALEYRLIPLSKSMYYVIVYKLDDAPLYHTRQLLATSIDTSLCPEDLALFHLCINQLNTLYYKLKLYFIHLKDTLWSKGISGDLIHTVCLTSFFICLFAWLPFKHSLWPILFWIIGLLMLYFTKCPWCHTTIHSEKNKALSSQICPRCGRNYGLKKHYSPIPRKDVLYSQQLHNQIILFHLKTELLNKQVIGDLKFYESTPEKEHAYHLKTSPFYTRILSYRLPIILAELFILIILIGMEHTLYGFTYSWHDSLSVPGFLIFIMLVVLFLTCNITTPLKKHFLILAQHELIEYKAYDLGYYHFPIHIKRIPYKTIYSLSYDLSQNLISIDCNYETYIRTYESLYTYTESPKMTYQRRRYGPSPTTTLYGYYPQLESILEEIATKSKKALKRSNA